MGRRSSISVVAQDGTNSQAPARLSPSRSWSLPSSPYDEEVQDKSGEGAGGNAPPLTAGFRHYELDSCDLESCDLDTSDLDTSDDSATSDDVPLARPKRKRTAVKHAARTDKNDPTDKEESASKKSFNFRPNDSAKVLVGVWKKSAAQNRWHKHAVHAYIDNDDRLRLRVLPERRDGSALLKGYPNGTGMSMVSREQVIFEPHLANLRKAVLKEFVRYRATTIRIGESSEERRNADQKAVIYAEELITVLVAPGTHASSEASKTPPPKKTKLVGSQTENGTPGTTGLQSNLFEPQTNCFKDPPTMEEDRQNPDKEFSPSHMSGFTANESTNLEKKTFKRGSGRAVRGGRNSPDATRAVLMEKESEAHSKLALAFARGEEYLFNPVNKNPRDEQKKIRFGRGHIVNIRDCEEPHQRATTSNQITNLCQLNDQHKPFTRFDGLNMVSATTEAHYQKSDLFGEDPNSSAPGCRPKSSGDKVMDERGSYVRYSRASNGHGELRPDSAVPEHPSKGSPVAPETYPDVSNDDNGFKKNSDIPEPQLKQPDNNNITDFVNQKKIMQDHCLEKEKYYRNGITYTRMHSGPFKGKWVSDQRGLLNFDGEDFIEYRVLRRVRFD